MQFARAAKRIFISGVLICGVFPFTAAAGSLVGVSDTISDSAPDATTSSHVIQFTVPTDIPIGGSITVRPENSLSANFIIPDGLDYRDVDFMVATSGSYVHRTLAATSSAAADLVIVATGTSGTITLELGDTASGLIPQNALVRLTIGPAATTDGAGDIGITNPSVIDAYRIRLETRGVGSALLDSGTAMIAIVATVALGPADSTDVIPPARSNGLPSGTLLYTTTAVQISLNTDKSSTCRYSTTAGIDYNAMTSTMTAINLGFTNYANIFGLTSSTSYAYYVRCKNTSNYFNTDDYAIAFAIGGIPGTGSSTGVVASQVSFNTGTVQAPPGSSSFSGPGPAGGPYLQQGIVTIDGDTVPGFNIVVLKDGVQVKEDVADSNGHFNIRFDALDRGTYSWGVYAKDLASGKNTSIYTSVIYLIGGTNNIIAPIYLSPTITGTTTVDLGAPVVITGKALPGKVVQAVLNKQGDVLASKILTASTTASANGTYRIEFSSEALQKGTYEVKAQSIVSTKEKSNFSSTLYVGVGESPQVDFGLRADLNKDKKVNLVDFSILLFNWKTADPVADINQDGAVSLVDFSIMLSHWTG